MKKNGYKIGFIICLICLIAVCGMMAYRYTVRRNAEKTLEEMIAETQTDTTAAQATETPTLTETPTPTETPTETPTPTPEEKRDPLAERGITIPEKNIDWEGLWSQNEHIYAWIYVPNTQIDYPIVQHPDDKSYYLDHNIDHSEGYPGTIYTQNLNAKDWSDPNTVIYGHNMNNGSMFHDLHRFEDAMFFDENQFVYIYTPEGNMAYEIFAAYPFSNVDILLCFDFTTPDAVQLYFDGIWTNRSMTSHFREGVTLDGETSNVITLSTCIGGQPESRYLVQAVLVE